MFKLHRRKKSNILIPVLWAKHIVKQDHKKTIMEYTNRVGSRPGKSADQLYTEDPILT